MGVTAGTNLLSKIAVQSFWNSYFAIPDPWAGLVYTRQSDQLTDTYTRLGAAPMPQAWDGDRDAKVSNEYSYSLTNAPYDATVKIDKKLIKYQQWDEVGNLVGNLGAKARAHQTKLITSTMVSGLDTVCEDGQFFFDDDHASAGAEYTTSQDNDKTISIVLKTAPTDLEFAASIRVCLNALYSFKDDRGDPTVPESSDGSNFVCMVAPSFMTIAQQVATSNSLTGPIGNDLMGRFTVRVNPFLTDDDTYYFFYQGSIHKPMILQETGGLTLDEEMEYKSGNYLYSASWWGAVGYGQWRTAIMYAFTTT